MAGAGARPRRGDAMVETRVLLALEPRMLRELLKRAIAGDADIRVVAELAGADVGEVLAAARRTHPHVAVLTLAVPNRVPCVGHRLLAEHGLTLLLLSDRVADALVCRGSPPRSCRLALRSTDQIVRAIRDAGSPA